jgi:hypothetical protein
MEEKDRVEQGYATKPKLIRIVKKVEGIWMRHNRLEMVGHVDTINFVMMMQRVNDTVLLVPTTEIRHREYMPLPAHAFITKVYSISGKFAEETDAKLVE